MQSYYYVNNSAFEQMTSVKAMLSDIIDHVRNDIPEVNEPEARTLFQTTVEVLQGLVIVYDNYERQSIRVERMDVVTPEEEGVLS